MSTHQHKYDADQLFAHDAQLAAHKDLFAKYAPLASEASVAATVAALQAKHKATVHVVSTREEALKAALAALASSGAKSISAGGSHTLTQIGYDEWAKTQKEYRDFKAESLAKYGTPESGELRRQGLAADVFFTSVVGISQEGELYAVDWTGSRTGGFLAAKHLVVVAGTQKIVANHAALVDRAHNYCLPVESARVRDAYKVPASTIGTEVSLAVANPFAGPRLTVILVKESLGF